MHESLLKKLVNAKGINTISKLVMHNCAIADQFNLPTHFVNHIVDNYKKQIKLATSKEDKEYALRVAKFRACNVMGGSDEQQMFVLMKSHKSVETMK